jgi:DNA replication licensing factor MCM2
MLVLFNLLVRLLFLNTTFVVNLQDVVDPVKDEMLANFVVDSHAKSQPKGSNIEETPAGLSQDESSNLSHSSDPEVQTTYLCYVYSFEKVYSIVRVPQAYLIYVLILLSTFHFQVLSQDTLRKYVTYDKLNVFPKLHDVDLEKLTHVYADLR